MNQTARTQARRHLEAIFNAALVAVNGRTVVLRHLTERPLAGAVAVVAIGKAAAAMLDGARAALGRQLVSALLISKAGHFDDSLRQDARISCVPGGHPLPDSHSLAAGARLLQFLTGLPAHLPLLFLLSGGASSLVEVLPEGVGLDQLRRANRWLLGSGLDIRAVNRVRQALSAIKGGRLLAWLGDRPAHALLISDVPDDDPAIIGSGLLYPAAGPVPEPPALPDWLSLPATAAAPPAADSTVPHHLVASHAAALRAGADCAGTLGYPARIMQAMLAGPAEEAARHIVQQLGTDAPGISLWGGETTVVLPEHPGRGGRNQQLALAAAIALQGQHAILLLAAGTDGNDGSTRAAGAIVDAGTVDRAGAGGVDAAGSLRRADAATCLEAAGDVLYTGPTGTNVMDMVIGLRLPG